jgi:protein O-GlcNAc transferase
MGVSHLSSAGLKDLIVDSSDEYIGKAIELASDLPRLAELRAGLRQRLADSPLCDRVRFTTNLEAAYRGMWKRWCDASTGKAEPGDGQRGSLESLHKAES